LFIRNISQQHQPDKKHADEGFTIYDELDDVHFE